MKHKRNFRSVLQELFLRRDQKGFSLAEVMVAAGMMGALSLVLVNISSNANKTTKSISTTVEVTEVHALVVRSLQIESACTETMTRSTSGGPALDVDNLGGAGQAIANIYGRLTQAGTYPVIITSNNTDGPDADTRPDNEIGDGQGTIHINSITVHNYNQTSVSAAAAERYGTVDVTVAYRRGHVNAAANAVQNNTYGNIDIVKTIRNVGVVATTAGAVKSCRADESQFLQAACDMLNGELDVSTVSGGFKCHNIKLFNTPDAGDTNQLVKYSIIARHSGNTAAINDSQGSIKAEGGLVVGNEDLVALTFAQKAPFIDETIGPGRGNALIQNALTVGNDATVLSSGAGNARIQTALTVGNDSANTSAGTGNAIIQNGLTVGPINLAAYKGTAQGNLHVHNDLVVGHEALAAPYLLSGGNIISNNDIYARDSLWVGVQGVNGAAIVAPTERALITGSNAANAVSLRTTQGSTIFDNPLNTSANYSSLQVNTVNNTNNTVHINSVTGTQIPLAINNRATGNYNFWVDQNGTVKVFNGAGTAAANEYISLADTSGQIGAYRPSYIRNMPAYSSGTLTVAQQQEIPTKKWVIDAVYNSLSDDLDTTQLLASISSTIAAQPFDSILRALCDNFRVTNQANISFASSGYGGGNCDIQFSVCGSATTNRCASHFSGSYDATGNINAGGNLTVSGSATIGINAQVNGVLNVYGSYIYSRNGYVAAQTYVIGHGVGTSNAGICGTGGGTNCATRFGRWHCGPGGVMVGIANGRILCAVNGSTSPATPIAF